MSDAAADRAAGLSGIVGTLMPAGTLVLDNPLVHANYSVVEDEGWRRWAMTGNGARTVEVPPITLNQYPPGTVLAEGYQVLAAGRLVREQMPPWETDEAALAARLRAGTAGAMAVDTPHVLLARYGEGVWGHWVAEMLVKAALLEMRFPGRFRYAVPGPVTTPGGSRGYATAVLESLRAYGIGDDRLLRLDPARRTVFRELLDVVDVWSDGIHPGAIAALRAAGVASGPPPVPGGRFSALRSGRQRAVFNRAQIEAELVPHGVAAIALEALSFDDQVRLFRSASLIVASLGSDCVGALFAPAHARIVTVAPHGWRDGYFPNIFQRRGAVHADIRGPSTRLGGQSLHVAPHVADPGEVLRGVAAVLDPDRAISDQGTVVIDGETVPRTIGATLLTLAFGLDGNAIACLREGWAPPEARHVWSIGPRSTIELPAGSLPAETLWMEIEGLSVLAPPMLTTRPLTVRCGGSALARFGLDAYQRLFCLVGAEHLSPGRRVRFEFQHPVCPPPQTLGLSVDVRPLGFGFMSLRFHRLGRRPALGLRADAFGG